jgi:hypothetical protein
MSYDFASLSPADFEDLVRDLVNRELGVRFEAFAPGPDGGIMGVMQRVLEQSSYKQNIMLVLPIPCSGPR